MDRSPRLTNIQCRELRARYALALGLVVVMVSACAMIVLGAGVAVADAPSVTCDTVVRNVVQDGSLYLPSLINPSNPSCHASDGSLASPGVPLPPQYGTIDAGFVYRPPGGFAGQDTILVPMTTPTGGQATLTLILNVIGAPVVSPTSGLAGSTFHVSFLCAGLATVSVVRPGPFVVGSGAKSATGPVDFELTAPSLPATTVLTVTAICNSSYGGGYNGGGYSGGGYSGGGYSGGGYSGGYGGSGIIVLPQRTFTLLVPQNQTIAFNPLGGQHVSDPAFVVSATASSGLPVTFSSTTPSVCTSSGAGGSTISMVAVGTCSVQADQVGSDSVNPAPPVTQSFTVVAPGKKLDQVVFFAKPADVTYGDVVSPLSATATSGLPVSFSSQTTSVCTESGGLVTLKSAGTCTIDAKQGGDTSYKSASVVTRSFEVAKATLVVTANDKTKGYSANIPSFGAQYGTPPGAKPAGVNGSPDCTTAATASSPAGSYPIICTPGTLSSDRYSFAFLNGTFTITPQELTVKPLNATRAVGEPDPEFAVKYNGFAGSETLETSDVTGAPSCTSDAVPLSPVGDYPITCTVGSLHSVNYTFVFPTTATLRVKKAS